MKASVVTSGPWTAISASVRGAQHERSGLPNQDAVATRLLEHGGLVVAVADGHGGARYVRSAFGAKSAVRHACEAGAQYAPMIVDAGDDDRRLHALADEVARELIVSWRQEIEDHVGRTPFSDEERERAQQPLDDDPVLAYGATVLCAIATPSVVVIAQLGDGDVICADHEDRATSPVPGDERLVGGATTSLALPRADEDVRVAALHGQAVPALVMLATDGYGNSFADEHWKIQVARDLRSRLTELGDDGVANAFPDWLAESAEVGGDDVTVVVLSRHDRRG